MKTKQIFKQNLKNIYLICRKKRTKMKLLLENCFKISHYQNNKS